MTPACRSETMGTIESVSLASSFTKDATIIPIPAPCATAVKNATPGEGPKNGPASGISVRPSTLRGSPKYARPEACDKKTTDHPAKKTADPATNSTVFDDPVREDISDAMTVPATKSEAPS